MMIRSVFVGWGKNKCFFIFYARHFMVKLRVPTYYSESHFFSHFLFFGPV